MYQHLFNFADVSDFLFEICVRYFLVLFSRFVRWKVIYNENVSFMDHASAIGRPDGYKWAINRKKNNDAIISDMTSLSAFFTFPCFSCQI